MSVSEKHGEGRAAEPEPSGTETEEERPPGGSNTQRTKHTVRSRDHSLSAGCH